MTIEEKIRNIELAPAEMQAMVAKAYLREDINDEDVQYLFNTDTIEELNENGTETVENFNAELPDGVGALEFSIRNYKPEKGNKNYITTGSGGWNTCVKGYPRDPDCDCLANCVGYASGRLNEIINEIRGTTGCTYKTLNCNAENFIERAKKAGLEIGQEPKVGAIGCAQKGATLSGSDGAGHVWIVEKVNSKTSIYTSESGYGSKAFWNQTRENKNGRWGLNSNYKFRGFIYLPEDVQKVIDTETQVIDPIPELVKPEPTPINPTPVPASLKVGDKVKIIGTGNGSSYGKSNTAYGIGWTRQILKIWEGRPYPYQVGNSTGTTGFYKAGALQRK